MKRSETLALALVAGTLLAAMLYEPKPTIFILREYDGESWDGRKCLVVDYTINGYFTSAVFYEDEFGLYAAWSNELERAGRVVRKNK